jgi:hypothetical protein
MKVVQIGSLARRHLQVLERVVKAKNPGGQLFKEYIRYDAGKDALVATDGKRMAVIKASSVFYDSTPELVQGQLLSKIQKDFVVFESEEQSKKISYPEWKKVWPDMKSMKLVGRYDLQEKLGKGKTGAELAKMLVESQVIIDLTFLADCYGYEYDFYVNKEDKQGRAIVLESVDGICSVLIMPIRPQEQK